MKLTKEIQITSFYKKKTQTKWKNVAPGDILLLWYDVDNRYWRTDTPHIHIKNLSNGEEWSEGHNEFNRKLKNIDYKEL